MRRVPKCSSYRARGGGKGVHRRALIAALAGAALTLPDRASAQQANRIRRVGILMPYAKGDSENEARIQALKQKLADLGWVQGRNIQFDERWTTDNMDTVRSQAASLMASNPDVVVGTGGRVTPILMQLSSSIPIVLPGAGDPVRMGYAKTLARPGGNVTGFALLELSTLGKSIEILKQIAPAVTRVAVIYNPDNPSSSVYTQIAEEASSPFGIEPITAPIHGLDDIDRAVSSLGDSRNSGAYFLPDVTTLGLRKEIVELIARHAVAAMYWDASFVKIGGLVFYGTDRTEMFRQSASYVDRILRGEKAADLPFQEPTKYELSINVRTAKALGLAIPQALLATADEVIE
jgi:putative tryptophan/tyrosine transport system substrate-binding protein